MFTHNENPYGSKFKKYPNPFWVLLALAAVAGFAWLGYQIPHHPH